MKRYAKYNDSGIPWIGEVPERWAITTVKRVLFKLTRGTEQESPVVICSNHGDVVYRGERRIGLISATEHDYQGVLPGDLLIHGMDTWHGAIAVSTLSGKCTSVVHVCDSKQSKPFIKYYLQALAIKKVFKAITNGVRQNTSDFRSWLEAGRIPVIIPTLPEQWAIVKYLDSAVVKIDSYIAAKESQFEKLDLLKQSIISQAVTKGIDPHAKMKDSGIPWIGQVPEHWEVKRLFSLASEHFISNQKVHHQNLLSLSHGRIIRKDIDSTKGLLPESFDKYQVIEPGNVVLRFTDLQNDHRSLRVGLAKEEGIITSAYLCIAGRNNIIPEYLYFILHVNDIHKIFYGMGGGLRQSLDFSEFRKLPILLPPLPEQRAIASFIDRKVQEIDGLIAAVREQIEKLKVYKQRLISDVVTGKIKVYEEDEKILAEEEI